ncbi:MAG: hypothetical protein R2713_22775 [Ilumatobacteraceae bacterium]
MGGGADGRGPVAALDPADESGARHPVAWRRMLDRGVFDGRGGRDGVDVLLAEQQVVNTVVGFDLHRG